MKVVSTGILTLSLLLSLGCTSVKVQVEYDAEDKGNKITSPLPSPKPPLDPKTIIEGVSSSKKTTSCPSDDVRANIVATAQQTSTWCWAASAQMVLEAHNKTNNLGKDFRQCTLVNEGLNIGKLPNGNGPVCCAPSTGQCRRGGWPQWIFDDPDVNFNWEWSPGPLSKELIRHTLCNFGPFIYVILYGDSPGGHSFVVSDYYMEGTEFRLVVHDHREIGGPATEMYDISYEDFVQGLWEFERYIHEIDYFQITPK